MVNSKLAQFRPDITPFTADQFATKPAEVKPTVPESGFKTEKGSVYSLDESKKTSRTKMSEGKGKGTTYEPHTALYVASQDAQKILEDMQGGALDKSVSVRQGYIQDGAFNQITDVSQIPAGASPVVITVDKNTKKATGVYKAKVDPEIGLAPIEKRYTEDGMSNTHIGNKIVEMFGAPKAAETKPTEKPLSAEDIDKMSSQQRQALDDKLASVSATVTKKEEALGDKKARLDALKAQKAQAVAAKKKVASGQLDIGETYAQTDEEVALENEISQLEDETRMIEAYERVRQELGKSEKNKPWEDLSADERMVYEDALGTNIVYDTGVFDRADKEGTQKTKERIAEDAEDIVLNAIGELTAYRKAKGEGKGLKNTAIAAYEINRKAESNYRGIDLPRWNVLPEPAKKAFLDKVYSPKESSPSYAGPTYEVQQAGFDAIQEVVGEELASDRPRLEQTVALKESEAAAQRRVRREEEVEELGLGQTLPEDIVDLVKAGDTKGVLEYLSKNAVGKPKGGVAGILFDKVTSKLNRLVAGALNGLGLQTKMQYVDTDDFIAYYDAKTDTVYVSNRGLNETAVLHELTHAATVKVISEVKSGKEKDPNKVEAVKRLEALMQYSKKSLGGKYNRAFKNVYEFIAYAMTDHKFQVELQKISLPNNLTKYSDIRSGPIEDTPNNLYQAFVESVADIVGLFRRAALLIKTIGVPSQFFNEGRRKSAKEIEDDLELSEDEKAEIAEEMDQRSKAIKEEALQSNPLIKRADKLSKDYTALLQKQRATEEKLVAQAAADFRKETGKDPKEGNFDALRKKVNAQPEMVRLRQEANKLKTEIEKANKALRDADLDDFEIETTVGDQKFGVMTNVSPGALGNLFLEIAGIFDTIIAAPPEGGIPSFTTGPLYVGAPKVTPEQQAAEEKKRLISKTEDDQTGAFSKFGGVVRNVFTKQGYNNLVRAVQNKTRAFVLLERNLTRLGIAKWIGDGVNAINTVYNNAIGIATNKSNEFKEFSEGALDSIRNIMKLQGKTYSEVLADLQMYMTGLHDQERRMELFYRNVPLIDSAKADREKIFAELRDANLAALRKKSEKAAKVRIKQLKKQLVLLATDKNNFVPGLSPEKFDPNSDEYNPLSYPAAVAQIFKDTYRNASPEVKAELENLFGNATKPGYFKQILNKANEVNRESNYFSDPVQNIIDFYDYKHYFPFKGRGGDTEKQAKLEFVDPFMSERLGNDYKEGQSTFMGRQTAADNPVLQIFTEATKSSMRFGFKDVPIAMKNLLEQKIVAGSTKPKITIPFSERAVPGYKFSDSGVAQNDFFVYKEDGSVDVYEINDPDMREAFKGLYQAPAPLTDILNKVTSTVGAFHTRYNPAFAPLDFTRNLMTYAGLLGSKYGPKAAGQMYAAMAQVVAEGGMQKTFNFSMQYAKGNTAEINRLMQSNQYYKDVKEYYDIGGQVAYMDGLTSSQALSAVAKKVSGNKKFNLENFNTFVDAYMAMFEITSRVAAFRILKKRFIDEGMSPEEAAVRAVGEAKDLANFQQVGTIGRGMGALFMFWRPAATGAVKAIDEVIVPALDFRSEQDLTEYYKTRPGATEEGVKKAVAEHLKQRTNARRMATVLLGAGVFVYIMAHSFAGEDDEGRNKVAIDDKTRWVRFARINLGIDENGRDLVFQIPWGFGPGALASAGAQIAALAYGDQDAMRAGLNIASAGMESFVPLPVSKIDPVTQPTQFLVDSVMPSILRPLLQFSMNTDGLGRKIYTDRQSRYADAYLGGDNVPEFYKDIAQKFFEVSDGAIDMSPGTLYFLANNYVDGLSRALATGYNLTDVIKGEKEFDIRTDAVFLDSYFKAPSNYDAIEFSKAESKIKELEQRIKGLEGRPQYADFLEDNPMAPAVVQYYNKVVNGQLRNLRQRANEVRRSDLTQKEKTEMLQLLTKQQNQIKMAFVNAIEGLETGYTGYEE
jgi:hypothetical protein